MKLTKINLNYSIPSKGRNQKREETNFENADFYENIYNYLISIKGINTKKINEGDICLYFDSWRDPYRIDNEIVYENCLEIMVGIIKIPSSLIFSEAICLNTYHGKINFIDGNSTWSQGSRRSPHDFILLEQDFYRKLKNDLKINEWNKDFSYYEGHITTFVRNIERYLKNQLFGEIIPEEPSEIEFNEGKNVEKLFERTDFYDPLSNILLNQDVIRKEALDFGDVCVIFDTWHVPYQSGNKIINEECIEVLIGNIKSIHPLTFSEAINLNTYQGNLIFSKGNITWSQGSLNTHKNLIAVDHQLFTRLKINLKTNKWKSNITYDPKKITTFVRLMENYFTGKYEGKNYEIIQKQELVEGINVANKIISLEVKAPEIAEEAEPGQFVVIRLHERGERIPLTIADTKKKEGLIRLIFQIAGKTTEELATLEIGNFILDVLGPLGNPIELKKYDKPVICIGGGVGIASIYSKIKALKELGNYVVSIIGARTKELIILENEIRKYSDEFYITTDDGYYQFMEDGSECIYRVNNDGVKVYGGFVSYVLEAILGKSDLMERLNRRLDHWNEKFVEYGPHEISGKHSLDTIAEIIAVGPLPMMKSIVDVVVGSDKYRPEKHFEYNKEMVKVLVSLNPIMVDGTGMCGGCRVRIFNPAKNQYEIKFACIDGPIFEGLLVDFETIFKRNNQYIENEQFSMNQLEIMGW